MLDYIFDFLNHGFSHASWLAKGVYFLIVTQLTIFSVTLYLHRSQSHRGVDFHPALAHFFRFWSWISTGMVTKEWVAIHRKHHAKCETEEDPHSPKVFGIKTVLLQGVDLYRVASTDKSTMEKYGIGTPNDWLERNLYGKHEYWGPTLMFIINIALFGIQGVAISALQMIWIPFWAAGVVNGLGHWWGYRNFETTDMSTNLTPWGFFIGGEELHNNHHAFPSSSKFALRKFEFDIGWAVIRGFEKLGLAKVLRVAPSLDIRPNVQLPDTETLKALLSHRFQVMTDYFRGVITPTLRDEASQAGAKLKSLPRALRNALANGGRWLDDRSRERLQEVVKESPLLATVCDFRNRLANVLERGNGNADTVLTNLQEWCREAEATGIRALQEFAVRLRGYALVPVHVHAS
jgi:stearoyl-CoA desaturase (delta-9 desaturase)